MPSSNPDLQNPRHHTRAEFLARCGAILGSAIAARANCFCGSSEPVSTARREDYLQATRQKSWMSSAVERWDVVTIGNLSRNRYWGESDERGLRPAICTSTLIAGDRFRLLVDPSLADADAMTRELDRRTGLKTEDITALFLTHEHGDHVAGVAHFPKARWLASQGVADILNGTDRLPKRVEGVEGRLWDSVEIIPTPGHTDTHHGLRFDCEGRTIVVAGDSVPTRDFFRDRRGLFNAVDLEQSRRTMEELAATADIIVPGHDNYFLSDRTARPMASR